MKDLGKHALKSPGDKKKKFRSKKKGDENAFARWIETQIGFVTETVKPKTGLFLDF